MRGNSETTAVMAKREIGEPSYESPSQASNRAPKCTRCRNHGILSDLRGHKHQCRFKDCSCNDCLIMAERQRLTAARIALYRQQKGEEPEMLRSGSLDLEHSLHAVDAQWTNGQARIKDERAGAKRKSDSGNSSPESFDSDYGGVVGAATKRLNVESPLTINSSMPVPSPQEILTRAFPTVSPLVLELVLKGCNGNIVQAIEVVTQSSMLSPPTVPFAPAQPVSEASAQGPSTPPLYPASLFKLNYMNSQYRYLMPPGMVPINSFMFPGAPGLGFPAPPFPAPQPDAGEPAVNPGSAGGAFDVDKAREKGAETCENCGRGTNYNGRCPECSASGHQRQ